MASTLEKLSLPPALTTLYGRHAKPGFLNFKISLWTAGAGVCPPASGHRVYVCDARFQSRFGFVLLVAEDTIRRFVTDSRFVEQKGFFNIFVCDLWEIRTSNILLDISAYNENEHELKRSWAKTRSRKKARIAFYFIPGWRGIVGGKRGRYWMWTESDATLRNRVKNILNTTIKICSLCTYNVHDVLRSRPVNTAQTHVALCSEVR